LTTGKYHSGYPIVFQVNDAPAYLNISNLEQNGIWDMTSMLGANVKWTSGFYHSKYQNTIGKFWSLYVNQKEHNLSYLLHSEKSPIGLKHLKLRNKAF
jgi:hypothetical protein